MAEDIRENQMSSGMPAKLRGLDSDENSILIEFNAITELLTASCLKKKGGVSIPSWNNIGNLDTIIDSGIYRVTPQLSGAYGLLLVIAYDNIHYGICQILSCQNGLLYRANINVVTNSITSAWKYITLT